MKPLKNIRYCLLIIIPLLLISFTVGDCKSDYNIPLRPTSIFTDDIDLDNDQDLIIGHLKASSDLNPAVTILKNNGSGYFDIFDTSVTHSGYQYNIFSSNLYGDQYPEIVTVLYDSEEMKGDNLIRILNLNSTGVISYNDIFISSDFAFEHKTYGDANGDNLSDIIIASYGCQCWGILYNLGQGNFTVPEYYNTSFSPTDVSCGRLNDDPFDDIVIGGADVNIYLSNGSGFDEIVFTNGSWDVFIDDFDNDGDNDIVGIDGMYTWNYFSYMENTGNGNFIQHPDTTTHPGGLDFSLTDLDNDGLSEILCLSNGFSGIYIFYNKGNFHLGEPVFIPVTYLGEDSRRFHCDDLDNNGFNDIIIVRRHGSPLSSNLIILFNDGNGNFVENPITDIEIQIEKFQNPNLFCYPNPFHSNATIEFVMEKPGKVDLALFDIYGSLVKELLNNELYQPGVHGFPINVSKLPEGIYLIKMTIDKKNTTTIKIIIN